MVDILVLGAGVAGLACARRLAAAGAQVLVVDRADKPGGRCATRWHDGVPFDYGPLFLHGSDKAFLRELQDVEAEAGRLPGWPQRVNGTGAPCQPRAFTKEETRVAFAAGVHAFPRTLARGLDIRLNTLVLSIKPGTDSISVETDHEDLQARDVVIAFALEQCLPLLRSLGQDAHNLDAMLGMFATVPCLAVAAGYPAGTRLPEWDLFYPEEEDTILLVGNELSKRPSTREPVLTIQAVPRWSRRNLEKTREQWSRELLAAAARRLGPWAAAPQWVHPHRWRFSRLDPANELATPVAATVGSCRIGLAGELFGAGGGIQAAWKSGGRLAEMLLTR
ncbi:MAG TPA: FAD-dependent oxidoreductase [Spirochaetia bacterium]|nr:FAD-dependent oxidoreductase [Spirochaetia bacterium]